jgi:hypothetical protein
MSRPPTIDMAMAGIVMRAQCASNTGRAARHADQQFIPQQHFSFRASSQTHKESFKPTNTHHDEEPSAKSPKVDDCISRALHEIIRI